MDADPFGVEPPPVLRAAYLADVIDAETFETFVGHYLAGRPVALPTAVIEWSFSGRQRQNTRNVDSILKSLYEPREN